MSHRRYKRWCYNTAHRQGKILAWAISTILLELLLDDASILERFGWAGFNLIYWFGTNTFAYLSETLHNWRHTHNKF